MEKLFFKLTALAGVSTLFQDAHGISFWFNGARYFVSNLTGPFVISHKGKAIGHGQSADDVIAFLVEKK